jgi:hypothetical protein
VKQRDEDDLHCTAPRCRRWVDAGQGNQWVDDKGVSHRYCWSCWQKMHREEEKAAEGVKNALQTQGTKAK